jgi:hypothetical protein
MSLVGRARDLTIEHGPVVACGIGRVSFCFLDPFSGLASVPAIHVGNRDELHVCLREEGVESCLPRLPAPMMPSRIFPFAEAALPMAGAPNTDAAPADTPTASTKPRRVIPSLDMMINLSPRKLRC